MKLKRIQPIMPKFQDSMTPLILVSVRNSTISSDHIVPPTFATWFPCNFDIVVRGSEAAEEREELRAMGDENEGKTEKRREEAESILSFSL
jgi:hypothetical protein